MGTSEQIKKLKDLRERGALTDEEFSQLKARLLELIENVFPIYKDHHMIVAKKVVNFDDLDNIRMLTTNSTDEWISYRYKKFEIFDRTK